MFKRKNKMENKIQELIEAYEKAEDKIIEELSKLKNWGENCKCGRKTETIRIIHEGSHYDEVMEYCLLCGGNCE